MRICARPRPIGIRSVGDKGNIIMLHTGFVAQCKQSLYHDDVDSNRYHRRPISSQVTVQFIAGGAIQWRQMWLVSLATDAAPRPTVMTKADM